MQFNCQSCQAKYQIADEKVAGKAVRMKCRKCGALIEVRSRKTESGLVAVRVGGDGGGPPLSAPASSGPVPASVDPSSAGAQPGPAPDRPAAPSGPPAPGSPRGFGPQGQRGPGAGPPAAQRGGSAARALESTGHAPPPRPGVAPRPGAGPLPRPAIGSSGAGAGARGTAGPPAAPPPRATSGLKPFGPTSPLRSNTLSPRAAAPAAGPAPLQPLTHGFDDDEATMIIQRPSFEPEALAGRGRPLPAAGRPAAAAAAATDGAQDEWYVGLGGQPVGPRPIEFLRHKLEAGEITPDSLVWNEDLPDWKPLRMIPVLAALLPADTAAAKPSSSGVEAAAASSSSARIGDAGPPGAVPPAAVSHPVALTRVKEQGQAFGPETADAAAPPASSQDALGAASPLAAAGVATARPGFGAAASRPADELLVEEEQGDHRRERRKKRRGMQPIAWAFVAMAGGFGAVAAYVVLSSPPSVQPLNASAASVLTGTVGAATPGATGAGTSAASVGTTIVLEAVSVRPEVDSSGRPLGSGVAGASTGTSAGRTDIDTSGFNTGGPSGPAAAPGGPSGSDGRGELTQADISSVVNRYKGGVSRKCMPIVEAGSPSGATSARVVARLMIGPSGNVDSASATGGGEFPGLADCVASRVRTWKFPASGGSTPVDVPFHFIAQ